MFNLFFLLNAPPSALGGAATGGTSKSMWAYSRVQWWEWNDMESFKRGFFCVASDSMRSREETRGGRLWTIWNGEKIWTLREYLMELLIVCIWWRLQMTSMVPYDTVRSCCNSMNTVNMSFGAAAIYPVHWNVKLLTMYQMHWNLCNFWFLNPANFKTR